MVGCPHLHDLLAVVRFKCDPIVAAFYDEVRFVLCTLPDVLNMLIVEILCEATLDIAEEGLIAVLGPMSKTEASGAMSQLTIVTRRCNSSKVSVVRADRPNSSNMYTSSKVFCVPGPKSTYRNV